MLNKYLYYIIQFIVFCASFSISYMSAAAIQPEATDDLPSLINMAIRAFMFVFWSHVIFRFGLKRLKPKLRNRSQRVLAPAGLILLAASCLAFIKPPLMSTSLDSGALKFAVSEKQTPQTVSGTTAKAVEIVVNSLLYGVWAGFYLTLTTARDRKKVQSQLQAQQLENLQNQLNPHFLFNALNSVRAMIFEDRDKAADLVTELSELFRYNLTTQSDSLCTLEQELAICRRYLNIESTRLGERLRLDIKVPNHVLACQIPAMSLLTLVENAVKHGIAPLPQGGELSVFARLDGRDLQLDVSNPYSASKIADGTKTGLSNLTQRLAILYGQSQLLNIRPDLDTFNVNLRIPYAH